jgi:hypothetical protein
MSKLPTMEELGLMSPEEKKALERKMMRQVAINLTVIFVTKAAILYGISRWAKSIKNAD